MKKKTSVSLVTTFGFGFIANAYIMHTYLFGTDPSRWGMAGIGIIQFVLGIAAAIIVSFDLTRKVVSTALQNFAIAAIAFGSCLIAVPLGGLALDLLQTWGFKALVCMGMFAVASGAALMLMYRFESPSIREDTKGSRPQGPPAFPAEPA
jgi:hypothetical protein